MQNDRHDWIFRAVADSTRRSILERLQLRELTVLELCEPFRMTQPSLSKHLAVLRRSGLIVARRSGRHRYYRLRSKPLERVATWAAQVRDVSDPSGHVWHTVASSDRYVFWRSLFLGGRSVGTRLGAGNVKRDILRRRRSTPRRRIYVVHVKEKIGEFAPRSDGATVRHPFRHDDQQT
jgi:DNA-binding transcriptional ArsR family regulator